MEEKIRNKINSIVDFIVAKPDSEITKQDYDILDSVLKNMQYQKQQESNSKRWVELISSMCSTGIGYVGQ